MNQFGNDTQEDSVTFLYGLICSVFSAIVLQLFEFWTVQYQSFNTNV